jgi:adenylate cyclase
MSQPIQTQISALEDKDFRPSRFTIRVKLLAIITVIVAFALLFMNYLSGSLFKQASATLIQEYNLSLARLMGSRIEKELQEIIFRIELITSPKSIHSNESLSLVFSRNTEIFGITVLEKNETEYKVKTFLPNTSSLIDTPITEKKMEIANSSLVSQLLNSNLSILTIQNMYKEFDYPVIGIFIPVSWNTEKNIIIIYLNAQSIIQSFLASRQSEIMEMYIVDNEGKLVLHSNPEKNKSNEWDKENSLVKKMISGKLDNGSQIYKEKDKEYLGGYFITSISGIGIVSSIPSEKAFEAVFKIQKQNAILLGIILVSAFIIVFIFAKTLTTPIVELVKATIQIEAGNFHIQIKSKSGDEIGILTNSFVKMAKGLWEKEKIKGAFGKFVNPEIVKRALEDNIQLGGVKKVCTVFFSDIRSFTNMSEKLEPEEVLDILNEYFTKMVDCIQKTDGVVDKFIGDAVMAHWGSLTPVENDSIQAVKAALMMRESLIELNKDFLKRNKPQIKIGCGINTGPVIAGQIGSDERLEFTVIGDAVNLASRIEYLNKYFGTDILVSESCYERLDGLFSAVRMPKVIVKGKEKPQTVYAILGYANDSKAPQTLEEMRLLVGIEYKPKELDKKIQSSSDNILNDAQ